MPLDGECITQVVYLVKNDPNPTASVLPAAISVLRDCCSEFFFKVLADSESEDEFKNDKNGFLFPFEASVNSAELKLLKWNNSLDDYEEFDLNNNDYGTFKEFETETNEDGQRRIGYQIEWKKVLVILGIGTYKVRATGQSVFGETILESLDYCLEQFTVDRANRTVRIEYYSNGTIGDNTDDTKHRSFGDLNWYNALRVEGYFGFGSFSYEQDFIEYANGQRVNVKDVQEPEYVLKLKPTFNAVHEIMRTEVLQSGQILITDYNVDNPGTFIKKSVIKNSDYAPDWKKLQSKLAGVEVKFKQRYNNLINFRC